MANAIPTSAKRGSVPPEALSKGGLNAAPSPPERAPARVPEELDEGPNRLDLRGARYFGPAAYEIVQTQAGQTFKSIRIDR